MLSRLVAPIRFVVLREVAGAMFADVGVEADLASTSPTRGGEGSIRALLTSTCFELFRCCTTLGAFGKKSANLLPKGRDISFLYNNGHIRILIASHLFHR